MARLLVVGHVTWDKVAGADVLGGSAAYAALTATKLGWETAVLTSAGRDFLPERDLPGVTVFVKEAAATTRFENSYAERQRRQRLRARADQIDLAVLPDPWRSPDALFLAPVAGEIAGGLAPAFEAGVVGAGAQGWLRQFDADGAVSSSPWRTALADLAGVHVLFLSEQDTPDAGKVAHDLMSAVPIVALTRGWEGLTLMTREGMTAIPSLPREEVDPTGAGDVFAAAFLVRYHETNDAMEAAAFGACAASCAVEAVGTRGLSDREEVTRRVRLRERLVEEGEWDE